MLNYCVNFLKMKLPEFTRETKNENPCPPWQAQMEADDFISCNPSYVLGGYWDKFDECAYVNPEKEMAELHL